MKEKRKKVVMRGTGILGGIHVPGGGGVFMNSVPGEYRAKYEGQNCKLFMRVVKLELVHSEFLYSTITSSSVGATIDSKFGHGCYISEEEGSSFFHEILRVSTITKDEAGVRVAVWGIFLWLHA